MHLLPTQVGLVLALVLLAIPIPDNAKNCYEYASAMAAVPIVLSNIVGCAMIHRNKKKNEDADYELTDAILPTENSPPQLGTALAAGLLPHPTPAVENGVLLGTSMDRARGGVTNASGTQNIRLSMDTSFMARHTPVVLASHPHQIAEAESTAVSTPPPLGIEDITLLQKVRIRTKPSSVGVVVKKHDSTPMVQVDFSETGGQKVRHSQLPCEPVLPSKDEPSIGGADVCAFLHSHSHPCTTFEPSF